MVNGNIYNNALPKQQFNGMNAIIPEPPYLYIAESYENAYETAFVAEDNVSLNNIKYLIFSNSLPNGFINGTLGYQEVYENIGPVSYLTSNVNQYMFEPYLYISAGSGGGSGYMYLNWIVVTFGVPYEVAVP